MSVFVLSLKEPPRAATFDGMEKQPFKACWLEMKAILPGISLLSMLLDRTPKKTIGVNLLVLAVLGFATVQMVQFCYSLVDPASITTLFHLAGIPVTSHTIQWSIVAPVVWLCLGVAIYRLQNDIDSRFARARDAGEVMAADPVTGIA